MNNNGEGGYDQNNFSQLYSWKNRLGGGGKGVIGIIKAKNPTTVHTKNKNKKKIKKVECRKHVLASRIYGV